MRARPGGYTKKNVGTTSLNVVRTRGSSADQDKTSDSEVFTYGSLLLIPLVIPAVHLRLQTWLETCGAFTYDSEDQMCLTVRHTIYGVVAFIVFSCLVHKDRPCSAVTSLSNLCCSSLSN